MSNKILIVAATDLEADAFKRIKGIDCDAEILVSGIGVAATAYSLTRRLYTGLRPSAVINIGIAGSYRQEIAVGDVTVSVSDCFGDAGVESDNGFMTLFESGLLQPSSSPFTGGRIVSENVLLKGNVVNIKPVNAVTLNRASASLETINFIRNKYNPDIETMEGASFFYICTLEKIPFLAIRGISNMVGKRDKTLWDVPLAVSNLSVCLKEILLSL